MVIIPSSHPPAKGPRRGHQHHSHNLLNVSCFRMPRRVQAGLYGSVNATWTSGMPTRPDFLLFGQSWIRLRCKGVGVKQCPNVVRAEVKPVIGGTEQSADVVVSQGSRLGRNKSTGSQTTRCRTQTAIASN